MPILGGLHFYHRRSLLLSCLSEQRKFTISLRRDLKMYMHVLAGIRIYMQILRIEAAALCMTQYNIANDKNIVRGMFACTCGWNKIIDQTW